MKEGEKRIVIGGFSDEAIGALVAAFRDEGRGTAKRRRRRFDWEVVSRCHEIWEMARKRLVVRMGAKRKVSHADVFEYGRGKLACIGITNIADFKAALGSHYERTRRRRR